MKKFLLIVLAALVIFPAAAQATVFIPDFEEINYQNIECFADRMYECEDFNGKFYAEEYADLLEEDEDFRLIRHYTDRDTDVEIWHFEYIGPEDIASWYTSGAHVEISANDYIVIFTIVEGIEMDD